MRVAHEIRRPFVAHANWVEIGWALRREFWGRGYASEIGHAGLAVAFDVLGVQAVVSCTVRHNVRSRAVMERIGMRTRVKSGAAAWLTGKRRARRRAVHGVCAAAKRLAPVRCGSWGRIRTSIAAYQNNIGWS